MENNRNQKRSFLAGLAGVIVALLLVGGGAAFWAYRNLNREPTVVTSPSPQTTRPSPIPEAQSPILEEKAQVYWLANQGDTLDLVPIPTMLQKSADETQALQTALTTLLAGDTEDYATAIPDGTQLLDLKVTQEGIYLDLSETFTEGGGSASMTARLKQILYTATSINPQLPLWLNINGQPLEVLGGEGLMVAQPLTRKWFQAEYEQP